MRWQREKRLYHRRAQEALSLRRRRAPRDQGVRLVGAGPPPGVRGLLLLHRRRRPARQGGGGTRKTPSTRGACASAALDLPEVGLLAGPHPAPLEARPRKSRQGPVGAGGLGRGARRDRRDNPGSQGSAGSGPESVAALLRDRARHRAVHRCACPLGVRRPRLRVHDVGPVVLLGRRCPAASPPRGRSGSATTRSSSPTATTTRSGSNPTSSSSGATTPSSRIPTACTGTGSSTA